LFKRFYANICHALPCRTSKAEHSAADVFLERGFFFCNLPAFFRALFGDLRKQY